MEEMKISDFDPEFLYQQLEKEGQNTEYWRQKYMMLQRELTLLQRILAGIMTEFEG